MKDSGDMPFSGADTRELQIRECTPFREIPREQRILCIIYNLPARKENKNKKIVHQLGGLYGSLKGNTQNLCNINV